MSTARTTPAQKPLGLTLNKIFPAFSIGIFVLSTDCENSIITQGKKRLHEISEKGCSGLFKTAGTDEEGKSRSLTRQRAAVRVDIF